MNEKISLLSNLNDAVLKFTAELDKEKCILETLEMSRGQIINALNLERLQAERKVLFDDVDKVFKNDSMRKTGIEILMNDSARVQELREKLNNWDQKIIDQNYKVRESARVLDHKQREFDIYSLSVKLDIKGKV